MSIAQKIATAAKLAARGDWRIFDRQVRLHWRTRRLRRAGARPFIHRTAGHPLICFPDLPDSAAQYLLGGDDRWELALLRRWLQPGDAFVDAGANLGLYAHAVAGHFRGGVQVLALEASPLLVEHLATATRLLGERNVQSVQVAVGAEHSEVTFYLARAGKTTVSQSMQIDAAEAEDYEAHTLPMRTLAELAAEHVVAAARVQLVKIDIEGAEPLALRGAPPAWFTASGPLWLVEINVPVLARMSFQPADVLQFFAAEHFQRWLLPKYPHPGEPPPRPRPLTAGEKFSDALFYNLVALPLGAHAGDRRARVGPLFA